MTRMSTVVASMLVYVATGTNPMGERIVAEMIDADKNGTVMGAVYDRTARVPVVGEWSGAGMMRVRGPEGREYELEVVDNGMCMFFK